MTINVQYCIYRTFHVTDTVHWSSGVCLKLLYTYVHCAIHDIISVLMFMSQTPCSCLIVWFFEGAIHSIYISLWYCRVRTFDTYLHVLYIYTRICSTCAIVHRHWYSLRVVCKIISLFNSVFNSRVQKSQQKRHNNNRVVRF